MIKQKQLVPKRRFEGFKEKWSQFFISEFCDIKTGGTPSTKVLDYWYPAEIPWMSSGEVNKKRLFNTDIKISKIGLNNSSARWIKKDSILIGLAGQGKTRGTVAINKIPLTSNQSIAAIELKNGFNSEFLFQNLGNRYEELRTMSSGDGSRGGLNKKIISEIRVFLPNDVEQQKIGQFFKQLDEMIALQQRKLDKTKALKSAYLAEMFPAEGEHVPKRRFAGFTDEWEKNDLGKLGIIQSGIGFPEKDQGGKKGIPFIKVSDMNIPGNEIELIRTNHYVNQKKIDEKRWHPITETPALIFAKVGAAIFLGRKRLINQPFLIDNNMMSYAFNSFWDIYFGKILFEKLNLSRYAQVGALPSLSASDIANIRISIPTKKEQQKIGQFFKHLDEMIATHQQKLEKLKATKQAYLHEMFV